MSECCEGKATRFCADCGAELIPCGALGTLLVHIKGVLTAKKATVQNRLLVLKERPEQIQRWRPKWERSINKWQGWHDAIVAAIERSSGPVGIDERPIVDLDLSCYTKERLASEGYITCGNLRQGLKTGMLARKRQIGAVTLRNIKVALELSEVNASTPQPRPQTRKASDEE